LGLEATGYREQSSQRRPRGSGKVNGTKIQNRKRKVPPQIATLVFAVGIAGLFYLDRDSEHVSKALWLPVIWLSTNGSRSVSAWLGMGPPTREMAGQLPATSLLDQLVAGTLMLLAAIVLIRRRKEVRSLLKASWPIMLYYSFCLVSLLWSDFPGWGLKRWVRGLGDLVMVLIVATEAQPTAALRRLFSRVGFVLLPASVLLIKYYPELGWSSDAWGDRACTGVTTNKNILGNVAFLLALGALWQVLRLVRDTKEPNRTHRLLAQCTLLAFGIELLFAAHSATSGACFILGAGLMLATSLPPIRRRPAAVQALVLAILLGGGLTEFLGGRAEVAAALGRNADFTGRTEIWRIVIPMVNPIGGAGFESFWLGSRVAKVFAMVAGGRGLTAANEAHNGYIEVYLNLGCLGLGFVALLLVQGYGRTVSAFRRDRALGALLMAYVVTAVFYNVTEAGFRILSLEWFFLLLSVVAANRVTGIAKRARRSDLSLSRTSWPGESPSPLEMTGQRS
jgi:exopolysaccharide production protein ExoQ